MRQKEMTDVVAKADLKGEKGSRDHEDVVEAEVIKKLNRNLLPLFFLTTVLCYVDRTNLAFAALQLNKDLGFTEKVYGLGSGIFFIGYSLFQVPSNMILVRVGAPLWLSVIVISWGFVATLFAGLKTAHEFYILRFLLGVAECGTFPGMWYYLSTFYSEKDIGMAYSWVITGTALSQVIGSPIAAGLLALDGMLGLKGWQWLFVVEGLPTILLGFYISRNVCDGPANAKFLTPAERDWLIQRNAAANAAKSSTTQTSYWDSVFDLRTYHVAAISFLEGTVKNSLLYWCPLIIYSLVGTKSSPVARKLSEVMLPPPDAEGNAALVALLTALPFGLAAGWMLLLAKSSQRFGERRLHSSIPFLVGAAALTTMAFFMDSDPSAAFVSLLGATIVWGPAGVVYSLPATFLQGPAAATGIALINSLANVGGMVGPTITGHLKAETGSYESAVLFMAIVMLAASMLVAVFPIPGAAETSKSLGSGSGKAVLRLLRILPAENHDIERADRDVV
ncbi:Putative tartrate transporter [Coccomyxa sp. Obi]|nr:Putative tartrate transporter [Coccomyxa sp. Obi]